MLPSANEYSPAREHWAPASWALAVRPSDLCLSSVAAERRTLGARTLRRVQQAEVNSSINAEGEIAIDRSPQRIPFVPWMVWRIWISVGQRCRDSDSESQARDTERS